MELCTISFLLIIYLHTKLFKHLYFWLKLKKNFSQKEIVPGLNPLSLQPDQVSPESMLESFCINFNDLCSQGKIGKIIGKTKEIERVSEILCRKNKNNPLLLGDPGVGKTAIVEGLASSIHENTCSPFFIK